MRNLLACLFATALAKLQPSAKTLLLACLCLACLPVHAQDKKAIDSLMRVYSTAKHDTTKILALTSIAYEYRSSKPDTCITLAEKALVMSEKIGFERGKGRAKNRIANGKLTKKDFATAQELLTQAQIHFEKAQDAQGLAWNYNIIGYGYQEQNKIDLAIENYKKSIDLSEQIKDKQGIASSLNSIGIIYKNQGNYPLSLEYYQKSLKVREEIRDKQGTSVSLNNIGIIYYFQSNYPLALEYYRKSLKIDEELGDQQGIVSSFINMGNIYYRQGSYPSSLEYYEKSLKISKEIGYKQGISYNLNNIGDIYFHQNNYPLALEYYQKSLKIKEEIDDKWGATYSWNGLAAIAQKQKDYDKSIEYAQKSLQIAQEIKALEEIKEASKTLYDTYKIKGDYLKALEYHELYKTTNDSLFNADKAKKIADLESKAEVERKEKAIELLNKDAEIQRIEIDRQKNARLAIEKQAEADNLFALARQEKDKRKQDSLRSLAQKNQLEADNFKAKGAQLKAEGQTRELELLKEKEAKEFQQYINYLVLAGLLSVTIFAYFIYQSRKKQIKAKLLAREQKEEISQMNEELNTTLNAVEIERAKSDKLLLNILPVETATELKEKGFATPKHYELITVLFTDFKGFTNIAEKMTPTEVIENLNTCFYALDLICDKYGLEKIKTIGDSYMCAGGLPIANTTNPIDVVSAGLEMQEWMAGWIAGKRANGQEVWELRLGIHSGEAVAGVVGKNKFAYDIWGDTVNLASRMESSGEVGKVNISGATYELVKDKFVCTHRGAVKAKNKGEVEMYFVEGAL